MRSARQFIQLPVLMCIGIIAAAGATAVAATETEISAVPPHVLQRPSGFQAGETLTYSISWSRLVTAGVLTTEVREEKLPDGREGLLFFVTGSSTGLLDAVFPVHDTVRALFDPVNNVSLSYLLTENYGTKKRRRIVQFDRANNSVLTRLNDDQPETLSVPEKTLDALTLLYVLRLQEGYSESKTFAVPIHDSGKIWSVEIQTLGKEHIETPAGEFSTIKIRTYPRYKGEFMNKGVVVIWLTDDARKIPVLAKSTLKVGSFVITLTDIKSQQDSKKTN